MNKADINWHKLLLIILFVLGGMRIAGLYFSPLGLHGDEAQYWAWSRNMDFGYFSKPPMIAWLIAATTAVFGNDEWAVRISSPILHPLISYIIFLIGKNLYDVKTGFWAAIIYFTMPAVWLSSGIVSTDVPLLLFWSLSLLAFLKLRQGAGTRWAFGLGLSFGFGILSKYAMLFFLPAIILAIIIDAKTRKAIISKNGILSVITAFIIILPNIIWNKNNDFATINHTVANANIGKTLFHPKEALEFFGSQFGVFGPVLFLLLLTSLFFCIKGKTEKRTLLLAFFVLSPLLIILLEALLSRANANWAVTAYIAASVLLAYFGTKYWAKWLKAGLGINIIIGVILVLGGLVPSFADSVGQANAFKRMRAWPETLNAILPYAKAGFAGDKFSHIAFDNRLVFYDMKYYGLEEKSGLKLAMWLKRAGAHNHAETTSPLPASDENAAPVLIVNYYQDFADEFEEDFARLEKIGTVNIDLGGGKTRTLYLWAGRGYTPTSNPER